MMNIHRNNDVTYNHRYICTITADNGIRRILDCPKLPPILKALREESGYQYKIPHGNKVRTLILEQGVCHIECGEYQYDITIERW